MRKFNLFLLLIALITIASCASNKPATPQEKAMAVKLQEEARKLADITNPDQTYRLTKTDKDSIAIELLERANLLDLNNKYIALDLSSMYYRNSKYKKAGELAKKYLKIDSTGNFYNLCGKGLYMAGHGKIL